MKHHPRKVPCDYPGPLTAQLFIERTRHRFGLNQGQFAHLLGINQRTVSDWEHGLGLRPVKLAMKLLKVLVK